MGPVGTLLIVLTAVGSNTFAVDPVLVTPLLDGKAAALAILYLRRLIRILHFAFYYRNFIHV